MSKPRYWWYHYVCAVIAQYPDFCRRESAQQGMQFGAKMDAGGVVRPVEAMVTRAVAKREHDDYLAVKQALEVVKTWPDADEVLRVIDLRHWQKLRNFDTIGYITHMSERTVRRKNQRFVYLVAYIMGYLE